MPNIDAIKNLKETAQNSLDNKEKADLKNISPDEMKKAIKDIEQKTFSIDGKNVSLKNVVKGLSVSPDGNSVTFKGKKIEASSELGAALQALLIANGKSIGSASIDGTIGAKSAQSLQQLQSEMKVDATTNQPRTPETIVSPESLDETPLGRVFDGVKPGTYNKFKKIKLLNEKGFLNDADIKGKKCTIEYKSEVDGSTQEITVDLSVNTYNEVNINKFARDVVNKVDAKENALRSSNNNEKAKNGIDGFNESAITDPVVRQWTKLSKVNFKASISNGKIMVQDRNGNARLGFSVDSTAVLTNGKFDSKKFNNILYKNCYSSALSTVKADLNKTFSNLGADTKLSSLPTVDMNLTKAIILKNSIATYGHSADFKDIKDKVSTRIDHLEKNKKYLIAKDKVDTALSRFKWLSGSIIGNANGEAVRKNFDTMMNELKKIVVITKKGSSHYEFNYNTTLRSEFSGAKQEYTAAVDYVVKKLNGTKINTVGGDYVTLKIDTINR